MTEILYLYKKIMISICLIVLFIQAIFTKAQVALYSQCGGLGYTGPTTCSNGINCYRQHEYYSQCLASCPTGWDCNKPSSSTSVPLFGQCGGTSYKGLTTCAPGLTCFVQNAFYSQCLENCPNGWLCNGKPDPNQAELYGQCGGLGYKGPNKCAPGSICFMQHEYYSQCLTSCPSGWQCSTTAMTTTTTTTTQMPTVPINVPMYGQCGGIGYVGLTQCATGLTCFVQHEYYSQCLESCPSGWKCFTNTLLTTPAPFQNFVQLYSQCGGMSYTGPTRCANGLNCFKQNEYYSQCLHSCPSNWACADHDSVPVAVTPVGNLPTQSAGFQCKFKYGSWYNGNNFDYSVVDYIGIWIGSSSPQFDNNFNPNWHGEMLKTCLNYKKIPMYYSYVIGFLARSQWGLQDCDMGSPSLCQKGADFIRNKRLEILSTYLNFAQETASRIGSNSISIWLIEPGFWQYYGDPSQQNGGLSGEQMRRLFDEICLVIKSKLPNALISWDISPWLDELSMRKWWSFFATSNLIDFIHTSGGESLASSSQIQQNMIIRWSFMSQLTGKKIIADTGYRVAGSTSSHNSDWGR